MTSVVKLAHGSITIFPALELQGVRLQAFELALHTNVLKNNLQLYAKNVKTTVKSNIHKHETFLRHSNNYYRIQICKVQTCIKLSAFVGVTCNGGFNIALKS